MVLPPLDHAVGAERAAPVGAEFEPPPMAGIAKVDGPGRLVKDKRAGAIHAGQHAGLVAGYGSRFRVRPLTDRTDETYEVPVGDSSVVYINGCESNTRQRLRQET